MSNLFFKKVIQKALAGSRNLRIEIKREAVDELPYLCGLERGGIIQIDDATAITLTAVMQSGVWKTDNDRVITIQLGEHFDLKWFGERLENALENIEAIE